MINSPVASAIPGAVRAIYNALTTALPNAGVIVGPGATGDPELNGLVLIGVDDADEESYAHSVTGSQSWAYLGGGTRRDEFTVHCVAVAWNGNEDDGQSTPMLAAMDAVYGLLAGITQALVDDPTLSQSVLASKGITSHSLKFVSDSSGVAAHVPFDVECYAYI